MRFELWRKQAEEQRGGTPMIFAQAGQTPLMGAEVTPMLQLVQHAQVLRCFRRNEWKSVPFGPLNPP